MKKKRKLSFLLLELLIAMGLFISCILPLTSLPLRALGSEVNAYQRLQLLRLSDLTLTDIKASLFQNEIKWDQFDVKKKNKTLLFKDKVSLKGLCPREIVRSCYIWSSSSKKGKEQDDYRIVHIEVCFSTPSSKNLFLSKKKKRESTSFHYQVFVSQSHIKPPETGSDLVSPNHAEILTVSQ